MSITYTIYCRQPVHDLTPEQLAEGIISSVRPRWGKSAIRDLLVENTDVSGFARYRLCYLPNGAGPIDIAQWPAGTGMHNSLIADLEDQNHPSRRRIAANLNRTVAVVEISYDFIPRSGMAPVLAHAAAVCVAAWFGGMVHEPGDSWWNVHSQNGYVKVPADPADPSKPQGATPVLRYARPGAERGTVPWMQPAAAKLRTWRKPPPADCPTCGMALRSRYQSKRGPGLSLPAKAVMFTGVLLAATFYLVTGVLIRASMFVPAWILASVLFPLAMIPGLGLGLIANRFPKVLRLRCRKCGWRERFIWG